MNRLLTDEQYKECIPCYCDRCGMQLWMHILYPRVAPDSLIHYCVAKPPVLFEITHQEIKPMEMPVTNILGAEWHRQQWQDFKDGMAKLPLPGKETK